MSDISRALREMVVERAKGRCEYCRLAQVGQEAAFHIDHIRPRAAGGPTVADNLALACVSCSLHKAARLAALAMNRPLVLAIRKEEAALGRHPDS